MLFGTDLDLVSVDPVISQQLVMSLSQGSIIHDSVKGKDMNKEQLLVSYLLTVTFFFVIMQ